jgi:hypothetical protein
VRSRSISARSRRDLVRPRSNHRPSPKAITPKFGDASPSLGTPRRPSPKPPRHDPRPTIGTSPVHPAHPTSLTVTGEPARPVRSASHSPKRSLKRVFGAKTRLPPRPHDEHKTRKSTIAQVRLLKLDPRTYETSPRLPGMSAMLASSHNRPVVNMCQCNHNLRLHPLP